MSSLFQWLCVPFILTNPSSANLTVAAVTKLHQEPWIGRLEPEEAGRWIDDLLLLVMDTFYSLKVYILKSYSIKIVSLVNMQD